MSYKVSSYKRLAEIACAMRTISKPPEVKLEQGDVVVVLDALEGYRDLFDTSKIAAIYRLCRVAKDKGIPVIFSIWARDSPGEYNDALDRKAHWSNYLKSGESQILHELVHMTDDIVYTAFTNAFMNEMFQLRVRNAARIVVAGSWTEACVAHTVQASVEHNKDAVVVVDACAASVSVMGWISLITMSLVYAEIAKAPSVDSLKVGNKCANPVCSTTSDDSETECHDDTATDAKPLIEYVS